MAEHEQRLKRFAHRAFYQFDSIEFRFVNDILAGATVVSILGLILETVPSLSGYSNLWVAVEYSAVAIFSAEYLLRIATERRPLAYIFSFYGAIDIIAILPSLLGIGNLTALKSARALRILRFLRIIRLTKISRLAVDETRKEAADLESFHDVFRLDLTVYFFSLLSATVMLGGLLFMVEPGNPAFSDIPRSMIWVAGTILGGVPGLGAPATVVGTAILLLTKFIGLILLGFMVSIIGKGIDHTLLGKTPPKK
jgi:voltage-gated potassium channel